LRSAIDSSRRQEMQAERMRILQMLEQGKIKAEEAARLLEALERSYQGQAGPGEQKAEGEAEEAAPAGPWGVFGQAFRDGPLHPGHLGLAAMREGLKQARGAMGDALKQAREAMHGFGRGEGKKPGRTNFSKAKLTRASLEGMQDGSTYTNFGKVEIADDVPEELLKAKIGNYVNFGKTFGPAGLLAILEDRCDQNFGKFEESDGETAGRPRRQNYGDFKFTPHNLSRMEDGMVYENHGDLTIADDVAEDLLKLKIGEFINHGTVGGPAHLVAVLEERCLENHGSFVAN
jgi:hypothetical protein